MVTDQTDFMVLYFELGIGPDCSMDGLRLAYRRRVADLHPDRGGGAGEDALKALNKRYAAAIDFHRHHGRLPGAPAPALQRHGMAGPPPLEGVVTREEPLQRRRSSKFVVYGIVVAAVLGAWWLTRTDAPLPEFLDGVAGDQRGIQPSAAIGLHPGMLAREVSEMLGDPVDRTLGGTHWDYGPSWVRFACGRVIDWYSSPLRPLKASRARPEGAAGPASAQLVPPRCPPAP